MPGFAQTSTAPRTIVVFCDGLTVDSLTDPRLPVLHALGQQGQIGLMNSAVAGPQNDTSALLTLALGTLAPSEPTDSLIYTTDEPVEGATAAIVYTRRTGLTATPNAQRLLHLGIASLTRRGVNAQTVGAVLGQAGKTDSFVYGGSRVQDRSGALFVLNAEGVGAPCFLTEDTDALVDWIAGQQIDSVVQIGGATPAEKAAGLNRFLTRLLQAVSLDRCRLLLVSPHPPAAPGSKWDRLPLALLVGAGIKPGLLTSATTRTPGLIANVDIAPTLLTWLNLPVPATMTGHPFQAATSDRPLDVLRTMDRRVTVNAHALIPVFLLISLLCLACVAGGLPALRRNQRIAPPFAIGLLAAMNMPLALLLVVLFTPASVAILAAEALALMVGLALLETLLPRLLPAQVQAAFAPASLPVLAFSSLTCLVLLIDALCGQTLVKFSLLSSYQLQGIRYYGLGNEYMGVLTGCILLTAFLARLRPPVAGALFLFVLFVIGFPRLGADAGGIIGASAGFGTAWLLLRGKSIPGRTVVSWTLLGIGLAFGIGLLERYLPGGSTSHIGGSLQTASHRGAGYLGEIIQRKILMNARIFVHPAMLSALAFGFGIILLARGVFRSRLEAVSARYPDWARGLAAAGYGALVTFLFNDSGIVAAAFLFGAFLFPGLYFLFSDPVEPASGPPDAAPADVV